MKVLIFDTETTGLPKRRTPANEAPNNWPHIVSISWVVIDSDTNLILKERSYIIKPNGWTIPYNSIKIHGITEEIASTGSDLGVVMEEFMSETCDLIVAHNMEFDGNVVANAMIWDLKLPMPVSRPRSVCTMKNGKYVCKLQGRFGYKNPKLSELYYHVFGKLPDETKLHNSLFDTMVLVDIINESDVIRKVIGLEPRRIV